MSQKNDMQNEIRIKVETKNGELGANISVKIGKGDNPPVKSGEVIEAVMTAYLAKWIEKNIDQAIKNTRVIATVLGVVLKGLSENEIASFAVKSIKNIDEVMGILQSIENINPQKLSRN